MHRLNDYNPRPWGHCGISPPNLSGFRKSYHGKVSQPSMASHHSDSVTENHIEMVRYNCPRAFIGGSAQTIKCAGVNARYLVGSLPLSGVA